MVAAGTLLAAVTLGLNLMPGSAEASFSGNNGKIAFEGNRDDPNNRDIYVMNSSGNEVRRLTNSPGQEQHPAFSPDGTRIAFNTDGDVWVMNANGTNQTRLTNHPFADQRPAWSPNGTRIAFASFRDGQNEIYVMDAADSNNDGTGDNLSRLTNNPASDTKPDFSPNGTRIAFHSDRHEGNGGVEIYTMDAADADLNGEGDDLKRLTTSPGNDAFASYSPTGVRIAFASPRNSVAGEQEIHVMDAADTNNDGEGDNLSRLVAGFGRNPSWSPDGTSIAFLGSLTDSDIFTVGAGGGGTPTNLTNTADPVFEAWPSWGPRPSDATPPETTLAPSGPSGTVDGASATFTFSSESNAAFDCKLDNGRFELCSSTKTYNDLPDGQHRFEVRATDTSGNTDPTPEVRTWTVDTSPPTLTFDSGPNGQTFGTGSVQTWTFTAADAGSGVQSVQCSVVVTGSPASYGACSGGNSSHSVPNLPVGSYTMSVRVTDRVGKVVEQSRTFSIVPLLGISDARVSERSSNVYFTVQLSAASQQSVTVNYATANGSAKAPADYLARSGTLTFAPGQTAQTVAVPIRNDRRDERTEFFSVNLFGANNATIADSSGRGTIIDNDRSGR